IFSFDQFRSIVFILISLVIGIFYNFGFLGITIKEINMMTSLMSVLLVGLGVDYGIQIVTNFNTYRREGHEPPEALSLTYTRAGMGIFLAALTTSLAFFVMAATGSKAFAQFGMVLGTGILQCFLSMFFLLPAFLLIFGKKDFSKKHLPNINYNFLAVLGKKAHKYRVFTIIVGVVVTGLLLFTAVTANEMDYDLMAMEPQDMPSMIQYEKIMDKYGITPFQAMVIAHSVEEAREFTEALEDVHLVGNISSISDLLPPGDDQSGRLEVIKQIRDMPQRYTKMEYSSNILDELLYEIQRFEWNIVEMGDLSVAGLGEDNKIVQKRNELVREVFGAEVGEPGKEIFQTLINLIESDVEKYEHRLTALDASFAPSMDRIVGKMASAEREMTIDDLPESIYNSYMDDSGQYNLITIYPKEGAWKDLESMERLNEVLYEISPRITGSTQIVTAWMDETTVSTLKAAFYITAAVLIFLFITFRSIRYTLLAAAPLIIG
ncbi:MAG: MMPL family transporter, partial [Spirochaetales bacterium]|nr:MMPL family transporter [Spirochaetales bacterium]